MGIAQQIAVGGTEIGGTVATMLLPAAWAGPVGAAVAGVNLALGLLFSRKRGKQKVATTHLVDELEPLLRQNRDGYLGEPRTASSQAAALKNFDDAWAWLNSPQACGAPDLGPPGQWCVNDRARGGKFDWFARYRDPIANDQPAVTGLQQFLSGGSGGTATPSAAPGSLLALVLLLIGVLL